MAQKLTLDDWATIRAKWEADPKVSFGDLSSEHPITKQAISLRARKEGWQKRGQLHSINERAIRKADAASDPNRQVAEVDEKPARQVVDPGPYKRQVSEEEAEDKRAAVLVKHRDEALRLDQMQAASQSMYVAAIRTKDKDDWWRAKIAADTIRNQVAASKMKQEMERRAWGLDSVIDPARMRGMSDEQLEALAAGKPV